MIYKIDSPLPILENAPFDPMVTSRKSSSFPTQHITKSAPSAASAGVIATFPLYFLHHFIGLYQNFDYIPVTLCPAFAKWPAIGNPITPKPIKANLCILIS